MSENGTLILAIGLPSTVGLIMLSTEFSTLFLGQEFREVGIQLLPWIAVGALLSGIRSFHYDLAFQLSNRTVNQIWVLGGAAIANLGLNLWLIPAYGALGAAYSTVVSFAIALVLSIGIGRRVLRVPLVPEGWYKVAILALTMGAAIHFVEVEGVIKSLVARIGVGGAVYLAGAYVVDLLDTRRVSSRIIGQIAGAIAPWK
jgi:O-antigen/teichoic acid export membrane protein